MANEGIKKTLVVALGVSLVCSILVATAAVGLKPIQKENRELDKLKNILDAAQLLDESVSGKAHIRRLYDESIRAELVDLASGRTVPESEWTDGMNPAVFDIKAAARDDALGRAIPAEKDRAQIKRMPRYMPVYHVLDGERTVRYILPLYGKGLWSTLYGFIALDTDLNTIRGFTFYEHGETPGLGGEVDNPRWKQIWVGKKVFDVKGALRIHVIKGRVDASSDNAIHQVDGLSGSTLTTRGVDHLVRFWLGEDGYGPLFNRLKMEVAAHEEI